MAALLCGWGSTLNAYQYSNHIFVSIGILKRIGHKRRRTKRKQKTHKKPQINKIARQGLSYQPYY